MLGTTYPTIQNRSGHQRKESELRLSSRVRKEKRIPSLDLKKNLSQFHYSKPDVESDRIQKGARSLRVRKDRLSEVMSFRDSIIGSPGIHGSPGLNATPGLGRDFPKYMIFYPQQDEVKKPEENQTPRSAFHSFKTLVDQDTKKIKETIKNNLFSEFRSSDELKKQLNFNKEQESLFRQTASSRLDQFRITLTTLRKESEERIKKMSKVRIRPSPRYQPQEKKADEESSTLNTEEEDQPRFKSLSVKGFPSFMNKGKLTFYWKSISESKNCTKDPFLVEGASFVVIGKYGYLYGGRSQDLVNDIARLDMMNWRWDYPSNVKDVPLYGRFGHTSNVYNRKMIIYGGVKNYNTMLNIRECLNDVRAYDPHSQQWSYLKSSGEIIEARRNHVAVVVGKHLLVQGGISSTGQYLDDLNAFDLISHQWSSCHEINSDQIGVAFHKACLVLDERRIDSNLFMMNDVFHDERVNPIKEEGVYFFGGRYHDGTITNNLKILKIGRSSLRWIRPQTIGQPPEARYLHTMVFCRSLNMLIIYGGRNDNLYGEKKAHILGDFYTLQLDTLTWVSVTNYGLNGDPRYSHVSIIAGTKLVIFGGLSFNHYCSSDINIIETNQATIKKLVKSGKISLLNNSPFEINKNFVDDQEKEQDSESELGIVTFLPLPTPMMRNKSKGLDLFRKNNPFSPKSEIKNDKTLDLTSPKIKPK